MNTLAVRAAARQASGRSWPVRWFPDGVRLWHFVVFPAVAMGVVILVTRLVERLFPALQAGGAGVVYPLVRTVTITLVMVSVIAWLALLHRQQYERRLLLRQDALETTRDFLASIIEGSGEAIVTLDAEGHVTSWNRAAEQIYGWSADEILGRSIYELLPPEPEVREELDRTEAALRAGRTVRDYEATRLRRDGRRIDVRITRSPLFDAEGRYQGSTGIVRDVTAIKELEARLLERECLAAVGEMAAQVAHEIRNPLMGIRGACEILSAHYPEEHPRREMAREAVLQVDRLNRTVEDLLTFGRPKPTAPVPTDLHRLIDRVLAVLAEDTRTQRVRIERRLAPDLPPVRLDPQQMEQVLFNVTINALQAMSYAGTLTLTTELLPREVRLRIRDSGPGIATDALGRIFKPFFTTRAQGTGLGLAIVRNIVLAHGGTVEAANPDGGGAEFTITLPRDA